MMQSLLEDFEHTIRTSYDRMTEISEAESVAPTAVGKWSKKEVLGHLIDSASNNHHRFVKAQLTDDLLLSRYEQSAWVRHQDYASEPWTELLLLWKSFNLHLLHVASRIPKERLNTLCRYENSESVTLGFLVEDYVVHMKHHLKQILG